MNPDLAQPAPAQPASAPTAKQTLARWLVVAVVVSGIIGTAWLIGERDDFGSIGQGGIYASLLPKVGDQAPDLVTFDINGNLVRLSDLRGQPVWLNFWGSWCPPCRAEFPDLQRAYSDLQPRGLVMFGIAMREDPRAAQDYADRVGGTFPILADPNYLAMLIPEDEYPEARALVTSYTINNYPTHIFIDRDGTVSAVVISPMTYEDAMAHGQAILDSPAPTLGEATPARRNGL